MKHIFLVEIELIGEDQWFIEKGGKPLYKKGETLTIPVLTNNVYNAERKVENRCCGSEYPEYRIKKTIKCDDFLFNPKLISGNY